MPRNCSICANNSVAEINSLIAKGVSFRVISRQILGSEKHHDSISRHAANCLRLEVQALLKAKKIKNAIDHYKEITEQLQFAKKMRLAAEEYLTDPDNPEKLTLLPHSHEIDVVYLDYNDTDENLKPKKKRANLDNILQEVFSAGGKQADKWSIKRADVTTFALNSVSSVDTVLDKIAKLGGLYTNERSNQQKIDGVARAVVSYLRDTPEDMVNFDLVIADFAEGQFVSAEELKIRVQEEMESEH